MGRHRAQRAEALAYLHVRPLGRWADRPAPGRGRPASAALAVGLTAAGLALVFGALRPRFTRPRDGAPPAPATSEAVVYVAAAPRAERLTAPRGTAPPERAPAVRPRGAAPTPSDLGRLRPSAAPDTGSGTADIPPEARPSPAGATPAPAASAPTAPAPLRRPPPAGAGERSWPGSVGLTPRAPASLAGAALDSAVHTLRAELATKRGMLFPPTDAERRAAAAEVFAASRGGGPATGGGGISIPILLLGGGPSRARRERDRTIDAEIRARLARITARAESVTAARTARRQADSVAQTAGTRPTPGPAL